MISIFVCLTVLAHTSYSLRVCKNERDYYVPFSKNCYDNPSDRLTPNLHIFLIPVILLRGSGWPKTLVVMTEILTDLFGFEVEEHEVTTEDGYILSVIRCYKNITKKNPVIVGHGAFSNVRILLVAMNSSIVYQLGIQGYDVWLINFRGSKYSRNHRNLTVDDDSFWNFSFHELGIFDLSAVVDHVYKITKTKILYVGGSMGTTALLVYSTVKSENANDKILGSVLLGTAGQFVNKNSTLKFADPAISPVPYILPNYKHGAVLYDSKLRDIFVQIVVKSPILVRAVLLAFGLLDGYDFRQHSWETFPIFATTVPDACTIKILRHYGQCISTGEFKYFDYGEDENIRQYASTYPPFYPVDNITFPIAMMTGYGDLVTPIAGSATLYDKLQDGAKCGFSPIQDHKFTHLNIANAKDIKDLVNIPVIRYLEKIVTVPVKSLVRSIRAYFPEYME